MTSSAASKPKTAHTPGPWVPRARQPQLLQDGCVDVDYNARPEAWTVWWVYTDEHNRRCNRPIGESYVVGQEWDAAEANARLIAAAPDLYEALQELVWSSDDYDESAIADARCHAAIERARAALAKTTA